MIVPPVFFNTLHQCRPSETVATLLDPLIDALEQLDPLHYLCDPLAVSRTLMTTTSRFSTFS